MSRAAPWDPEAFETRYARQTDPWNFASSSYEQGRYDAMSAALTRDRYARALEPGCAEGVFTERLAHRAGQVEAFDASPSAVARARLRCRALPGVRCRVGDLRRLRPSGRFDLIVLAEIGYYFSADELVAIGERLHDVATARADLLAVHWNGSSEDHRLHAATVHEVLRSLWGPPDLQRSLPGFRLDRWSLGREAR